MTRRHRIGCRLVTAALGLLLGAGAAAAWATPSTDPEDGEILARAGVSGQPPVMLVIDVSGSMDEVDGQGAIRLDGAREAARQIAAALPPETLFGVRTYPARGAGNDEFGCSSGSQVLRLAPIDRTRTSAVVRGLEADGDTPTASALLAAADELDAQGYDDATIVLLSDGESNCGPPACEVVPDIVSRGIAVTFHTIGFAISDEGGEELACIAREGGGTFADVDDADELIEQAIGLSRPRLELDLDHPDLVAAATSGPDGRVTITATVTSNGPASAHDVQAFIDLDADDAPGLVSPRRRLGNLSDGRSATSEWSFVTPSSFDDRDLTFTVSTWAANTDTVEATGRVHVSGELVLDDTGPILRDRERVVIMGDSYSAGEGAGDYLPGTFGRGGTLCHRSPHTYGRALWGDERSNIACSGAISQDLYNSNHEFDEEPSQLEQLEALLGEQAPDLVLLTLGGNDVNFGDVVVRCILIRDCHDYRELRLTCHGGITTCGRPPNIETWAMDNIAGLATPMREAYLAIHGVVNDVDAVAARGGDPIPVLVLGYVSPVPRYQPGRPGCSLVFTEEDLAFFHRFVDALNQTLEATVSDLQQIGVPVHFVPEVQDAFLPNNTYCDDEPYIRTLRSYSPEVQRQWAGVGFRGTPHLSVDIPGSWENRRELMHPTADGYRAITAALARWSVSEPARKPLDRPDPGPPSTPRLGDPLGSIAFADDDAGTSVRTGGTYTVTSAGHLPEGRVEVRLASTPRLVGVGFADDEGNAAVPIVLPEDAGIGIHHLEASGFDADGTFHLQRLPVEVVRGTPWPAYAALLAAAVAGELARRVHGAAGP